MKPVMKSREESRSARREAILDIARDCFLERGFAGTTMSDIAQLVGGSKGTLWAYFPCKEVLFEAVVERSAKEFDGNLIGVFHQGRGLRDTLSDFAVAFIEQSTSVFAIGFLRLMAAEVGRFPKIGLAFHAVMSRVVDRLANYLESEMDAGRLRCDDSQLAAQQFCALIRQPANFLIWLQQPMNEADSRIYTEASVEMFLRAYALDASEVR